MKTQQFKRGGLLGAVAAILLVFAFLPAPAESAGLNNLSGVAPVMVPAAAFVSDGFQPDSFFFPFGGGYFQGDANNYGCMEAPIYIPQGAKVMEVFASVYDNDVARGISIAVRRVDNFSGGTDILASMSTTGPDAFAGVQVISDITVLDNLITYPDYSYYVTTCLGSGDIRLYSVRLYFPQEMFLPTINR